MTVWSLETVDDKPCDEILAICRILGTDGLTVSPAEINSHTESIVQKSRTDPETYLFIDMKKDETDQMEVVGLLIRCKNSDAEVIQEKLKMICERSDVTTALLRGNLGLPSL